MKKVLFSVILVSFFIVTTVISSLAASGHEAHHSDGMQSAAMSSSQGMMQQGGNMMGSGGGNMMGSGGGHMMGSGMGHMMGSGMGMMKQRMAHMFFLDRADELGLDSTQIGKLKALHSDCRRDNIRNAAEAKIARLDLADLLESDDWSLKDAEPQIRKIQKLEGDIQVRHLQALNAARKVLTAEQLKQARSDNDSGSMEDLF